MSLLKNIFGGGKDRDGPTSNPVEILKFKPEPFPKPELPAFPPTENLVNALNGMKTFKPEYYALESKGICTLESLYEGVELEFKYRTQDNSLNFAHNLAVPLYPHQSPKYSIYGAINRAQGAFISTLETTGKVMGKLIFNPSQDLAVSCTAQYGGTEEDKSFLSTEVEKNGRDWNASVKCTLPSTTELTYSQSLFKRFHVGFHSFMDWTRVENGFGFHSRYLKKDEKTIFTASASQTATPSLHLNASYFTTLNENLFVASQYNIQVDQRDLSIQSETALGVHANYLTSTWKGMLDSNMNLTAQYTEDFGNGYLVSGQFKSDLPTQQFNMGVKIEFGDSLQHQVVNL